MEARLTASEQLSSEILERIFNGHFLSSENTIIVGGASEPLYIPSRQVDTPHRIHYVGASFASALHEIAHWLIAGRERRKLTDYGYWYKPDGRNSQDQRLFEKVEANNQSLEWLLARACGMKFYASFDNLHNPQSGAFLDLIALNLQRRLTKGLAGRSAKLVDTLSEHFHQTAPYEKFCKDFLTKPFRPPH